MENMSFKVGDRVKIKSLDWYNENSDDDYNVVFADGWHFSEPMSIFCGKELIIEKISHATNPPHYMMKDNTFGWTDEMIEGLVEDEIIDLTSIVMETVEEKTIQNALTYGYNLPLGYQFKDENGNVINATKIVLEKKKKEYPKTYEECCKVLGYSGNYNMILTTDVDNKLFNALYRLKVCRDAYWKIAGEEMGFGKPWEPDWNSISDKYCIYFVSGDAWSKECQTRQCTFAFPTPEMRDAFYENFKELIESVKELL